MLIFIIVNYLIRFDFRIHFGSVNISESVYNDIGLYRNVVQGQNLPLNRQAVFKHNDAYFSDWPTNDNRRFNHRLGKLKLSAT